MSFIRMYAQDDDGTLRFREAWHDEESGQFVVNHGTVGHVSSTEQADDVGSEAGEALVAAFAVQGTTDGYVEIPPEKQFVVVAQFAVKTSTGSERDRLLERKAKEALTGHLAWRGIGVVEGSSLGGGKLNIVTRCVDAGKAVTAIKSCLRETTSDFTKLRIAVAPGNEPTAFKLRHGPAGVTRFEL